LSASYVSYDSYLNFQGLTPNTNYLLYFMAVDLSANPSQVVSSPFLTDAEYFPAIITLCLSTPTSVVDIVNTIVESTSWNPEYVNVYSTSSTNTSYLVQLVPYTDSSRPISAAQGMDSDILFAGSQLSLCSGFTFTDNSYENMSFVNGWVSYGVAWSSDAAIQVWAVVQQDGWIYASTGGSYP